MFEKYLERLIKQKLGAFLEGVDENKLQFGMTEANLSLNNVKLKKDALIKLKMPITIELGEIRNLYIRVPWLKIGSQPVEVTIQGLYIIVSPQKKNQWRFTDIFDREYLEQTFLKIMSQVETEMSSDQQQGYFSKLAKKVLDNIQVNIKDIHFRFEDHFATLDQSYSFGIVLKRLEIQTTNDQWAHQFIDRSQRGKNQNLYKLVVIEGLGLYLNPNEKNIIYQQTENQDLRIQLMETLVNEEKREVLQYLLRPMNLRLQVEQQSGKKVNLNVELEKFHVSFLRDQLRCLIKALELVSEYQQLQNVQLQAKKFKFLRPITNQITRQNAREWWQYAFQCIRRSNRAKKGSIREFIIPGKTLKSLEDNFTLLLNNYLIKKEGENRLMLPLDDHAVFKHIMCTVDPSQIKKWTRNWVDDQNRKQMIEKKKTKKGGISSWFFGKGSQESANDEIISQQEAEAIEKELDIGQEQETSQMTLGLSLLFRSAIFDAGTTNNDGKVEGIRIFFQNIMANFQQLPSQEMAFELGCTIKDFGVDLYIFNPENSNFQTQDPIITSNKKIMPQNKEDQIKLKVRKRPEELKHIDFDIELIVNPFLLVYNKEFIKRVTLISKVNINQVAQNAAIDKIEDIREATSNSIYQLLYKKANRLRVNIASPVILLPIVAANDRTSPVWVLRLGDLNVLSQETEKTTTVQEYENYKVNLDQVRMQFFQTYDFWEKNILASHGNLREMSLQNNSERTNIVFSVIEECSISLDVSIKQKKAGGLIMMTSEQKHEYSIKPKLLIQGCTSEVRLNLSHSIYNKLVNFGSIFDKSSIQDLEKPIKEAQIESKQAVLKNALKIGQLQKKLDPLELWENYFCVLSGNHLYFYKDSQQIMPACHYYIKNAILSENEEIAGSQYNLKLHNRFGTCTISFPNIVTLQEWSLIIRTTVHDIIQQEEEARREKMRDDNYDKEKQQKAIEKKKKETNHEAVLSHISLAIPKFKTIVVDELKNHSEWLSINFDGMKLSNTSKKTESEMKLIVGTMALTDLTLPINSCLIGKVNQNGKNKEINYEKNQLEVVIQTLDKANPAYIGVNKLIQVYMNDLNIKFQPVSINEILKFVRNMKLGCSYNLMMQGEGGAGSELSDNSLSFDSQNLNNKTQQTNKASERQQTQASNNQSQSGIVNCGTHREVIMQVNVTMTNVSLNFLHQDYNMEMYRLDSSLLEIDYITKYDHMNFNVRFRDAFIMDLTCYPYTISPKDYSRNPDGFYQTPREMASIKNTSDGKKFGLNLEFESHQPGCLLKRKGIYSKMKLYIQPLVIELFNENFMRFFFYFFEQFLNALLLTDPYNNPMLQELERLKQRKTMKKETIKKLIDFDQDNNIMNMDIKISDFHINLPDRPMTQFPYSKNYLALQIKEFKVSQHIRMKAGRVYMDKNKELWCKSFRMQAEKAMIIFGGHTPLTDEPFNLSISFENLAPSPIIPKIDFKVLEQASHLRMKFDPVHITISQEIYTKILRILDLNINYTDFLEKEYYFFKFVLMEDYFKIFKDIVGMRIKIDFKCLCLRLEHIDQSFLSELMLLNMSLRMTRYRDFKNQMEVDIQNFFIFDVIQPQKMYKLDAGEILRTISQEDCVIQPKNIKKSPEEQLNQRQNQRQVAVVMKMRPNGEKDIRVDIKGLRITIKPHVLMMVYYFLLNSFPEYEQTAVDKPSYINFDPENAPKLEFKTFLKDCLLVFQNRPGLKTMACQGNIQFEISRQNVKQIKKFIEEEENLIDNEMLFTAQNEDAQSRKSENINVDQKSILQQPSKVNTDLAWSMVVKIEDFCPFVCSINQLNEKIQFHDIQKRQLMTNFSLSYITQSTLLVNKKIDAQRQQYHEFGAGVISEIEFSKIKAKISLQDLHLILQIVTFANYNIANEYVKKLENIDMFIKNRRNNSRLGGGNTLVDQSVEFDRKKTFKQDFGLGKHHLGQKNERGDQSLNDVDLDQIEDDEEDPGHLVEVLNRQYEQTIASQVQRLRSTTKAFSKIAQKYTVIGLKKKSPTTREIDKSLISPITLRKEDSSTGNIIMQQSELVLAEQEVKKSTKLTYVKNNSSQEVIYTKSNQRDPTLFKSARFETQGDDDQDEFYSANGDKIETQERLATEEIQVFLSPKAEDGGKFPQSQYEKAKIAANKGKIEFKSALQNIMRQSQTIQSKGIQILFINDYDDVFCPIIDLDIPEVEMKTVSDNHMNDTKLDIPKLRVYYFNPTFGEWEPFIESFSVSYVYLESASTIGAKQILSQIEFPTPIWINLTDQCFENLIETYYSWMETPPYQPDNYRKKSINRNEAKQLGSLNDLLIDKIEVQSAKRSQNGSSINDDQDQDDDMIEQEQESDRTNSERELDNQVRKSIQDIEQFNKVSPYSIRNLSAINIRVVKQQKQQPLEFIDQVLLANNLANSFEEQNNQAAAQVISEGDLLIPPNEIIQYTVDLDKESNKIIVQQIPNRKITLAPNLTTDATVSQRKFTAMSSANNNNSSGQKNNEQVKKEKNEEKVQINFDSYQNSIKLDLNKLTQGSIDLMPKMTAELNYSLQMQTDKDRLLQHHGSTQLTEDESTARPSTKYSLKRRAKSPDKLGKGGAGATDTFNTERIYYGVILNKMRKVLTVRQQYIVTNNTLYDFIIKITHQYDKSVTKEYRVQVNGSFGLNCNYFKNYTIQFRIDQGFSDQTFKQVDEESKQVLSASEYFSQPMMIEEFIQLNQDQGKIMNHDDSLFTYIKKQQGQLENTFDIVLLPPVSIKNCLPSKLEITSVKYEGKDKDLIGDFAEEQDDAEETSVYTFDKQEEKHLHIFDFKGSKEDEIYLSLRVSGYIWGRTLFKRKQLAQLEEQDQEVKIRDKDGISTTICCRLLQKKAGLQLIFYAHTVILNQTNFNLTYFQNSLNKQVIAAQHARLNICLFSKDESFIAGIGGRYSNGISIKNPGLTESFSILTSEQNVSVSQIIDDDKRTKKQIVASSASIQEKKIDFVYQTYMSLISEKESIYTKIVCIGPKYVIVNKLQNRIQIAQPGSDDYTEQLEPGERKEWFWADTHLPQKIVFKYDSTDFEIHPAGMNMAEKIMSQNKAKNPQWLWSAPININEQGIMSLQVRQDSCRFNSREASQIIRIQRKLIDGTTYVIIEEEDQTYPLYRIENLTDDIGIWYVQQDISFEDDACLLKPMSLVPFAFSDTNQAHPQIQLFFTKSLDPSGRELDRNFNTMSVSFENLNVKRNRIEISLNGQDYLIYLSVLTDGCSRIIRISNKSNKEEEKSVSDLRDQSIQAYRALKNNQLSDQSQSKKEAVEELDQPQQKVAYTMSVYVNEILISFVAKITEREENVMKSMRKEIAIFTVQHISYNKSFNSEENIDDIKFSVMKIQIDNQSSITPLFPTVLQPRTFKYNEDKPMIDCQVQFKVNNPDLTFIQNLDFQMQGIVVKLDDRFLGYVITYVNELLDKLKTNFTGLHPIFTKAVQGKIPMPEGEVLRQDYSFIGNKDLLAEGDNVIHINRKTGQFGVMMYERQGVKTVQTADKRIRKISQASIENQKKSEQNIKEERKSARSSMSSKNEDSNDNLKEDQNEQYRSWRTKKIDAVNKRIFIKECKISSVKIEISFLARKSVNNLGGKTSQSNLHQLDSWGLAVFNVDQVPIKVNRFEQNQVFGVQEDIITMLSNHFFYNLKRNILKLFFSFSLLGNPRKLVSTIRDGLYDFHNLPRQGQGFTGKIKGSALGTVSLLKSAFEGTFGVFEAFTGGVSKLALVLNQDGDYLGLREEKIITEKPRNLVEGVGFGCQTAVDSILSGISGLVKRPYIEGKRHGFKGFLGGVWSGTTGVILKPLSGGLDLISKTAEGMKNTVKIFEAQVYNERIRLPRTFYGYQEKIKVFNDQDAYIQGRILENIDGSFKKDHYIETLKYREQNRTMFLVLSEEHIILLDAAQKSMKWHIDSSKIESVIKFKNGLIIELTEKYDGRTKVALEITNGQQLDIVCEWLIPLGQGKVLLDDNDGEQQ